MPQMARTPYCEPSPSVKRTMRAEVVVPMLEAVGHPNVVNPDRALRKIAIDRDWPMLTFSNAVPLRERLAGMRPEHPVVSATVVGAGVAAAGLVWYASKKRAEKA